MSYRALLFAAFFDVTSGCSKGRAAEGYQMTGIRLNIASLEMLPGESFQLKASSIPAAANQPNFVWTSEDETVVSVSTSGLVKAVSAGNTEVTVSASGLSARVPVSVKPREFTYADTVIRMTLSGDGIRFAERAEYGIYIPTRTEKLRGVLILQHGCGMEQFGITRPYDLQYRAFAQKWNIAIIETALYGNCGGWRDPEAGTDQAMLKVLSEAAIATGHTELNNVPWLLWGHSGGGYWVLGMLRSYPERIIAAVCYSPAFDPQWSYPSKAAKVPVLTRHAGDNDANADGALCKATSINTFGKLRNLDAPVSIALNADQNHNYSYIRYMAIPFYEAVMKQRLIPNGEGLMKDLDRSQTWLGDTLTLQIYKESSFTGDKKGMCLFPDENTALLWKEYVMTGTVRDKTPPSDPYDLKLSKVGDDLELTWNADGDVESGILRFEIFRDNILVGTLPQSGAFQMFDTNGDNTIPAQVPEMKFRIGGAANDHAVFGVRAVNHFNLVSDKSEVQNSK